MPEKTYWASINLKLDTRYSAWWSIFKLFGTPYWARNQNKWKEKNLYQLLYLLQVFCDRYEPSISRPQLFQHHGQWQPDNRQLHYCPNVYWDKRTTGRRRCRVLGV